MTVLFLANVGNHDVQLKDRSLLPESLQAESYLPPRTLGEELEKGYKRYAPEISFPLIEVSLRWLLENNVLPEQLVIHLFASDQPKPPITQQGEWLKDTCFFAQIIKSWLLQDGIRYQTENKNKRYRFPGKCVRIHSIEGNPADYNNMLSFYSQQFPRIPHKDAQDVYLEVTGGTPAMTAMLILAGVDAFGKKSHTLYVEREADQPYSVGIGRKLFARQLRSTLREQIGLHAYAVACRTLENDGELILPDRDKREWLSAVLTYADRRLAFDYDRARSALHAAYGLSVGKIQSYVQSWQRVLGSVDASSLLAELIHSAQIKYRSGDYAEFVGRIFRFQEAGFRHLAEKMGIEYSKPDDDQYLSMSWVRSVPALMDYVQQYIPPGAKRSQKPMNIDLCRSLNRVNLGAIVDFFLTYDEQWNGFEEAVDGLHRLTDLAKLRNKGLSGHGFQGIGKEDLEAAFGDPAELITPWLEGCYQSIFGVLISANPYEQINKLCLEALDD